VAEVLVQFTDRVAGDGMYYAAKACGAPTVDGLWQGWIEFTPSDGGAVLRSGRETTQPNREDTIYWATGLTAVYLEGALHRTLKPRTPVASAADVVPAFDGPAPDAVEASRPSAASILDPFSVYRKGESVLRRQLGALSDWHLVNIIQAYGLSGLSAPQLNALTGPALVELIVGAVRKSDGDTAIAP
jgi:hypothetical protein